MDDDRAATILNGALAQDRETRVNAEHLLELAEVDPFTSFAYAVSGVRSTLLLVILLCFMQEIK